MRLTREWGQRAERGGHLRPGSTFDRSISCPILYSTDPDFSSMGGMAAQSNPSGVILATGIRGGSATRRLPGRDARLDSAAFDGLRETEPFSPFLGRNAGSDRNRRSRYSPSPEGYPAPSAGYSSP